MAQQLQPYLDGARGDAADVHDVTSVGLRVHHLEASILTCENEIPHSDEERKVKHKQIYDT